MRSALCALVLAPSLVFAMQAGISGYSGKTAATNCTACHTGGANPSAAVGGPSQMAPYTTSTFTVTITAGAVTTTVAGLDVALGGLGSTGAVMTAGSNTKVLAGEITQIAPAPLDAGIFAFNFTITAGPVNGPMTLYVAAVAGNGTGTEAGDGTYSLTRTVTIFGDAGMPAVDSGTPGTDGGGVTPLEDGGLPTPPKPAGPPGGFVGGDYGCNATGGMPVGAWLLGAALVLLLTQRRSTKST